MVNGQWSMVNGQWLEVRDRHEMRCSRVCSSQTPATDIGSCMVSRRRRTIRITVTNCTERPASGPNTSYKAHKRTLHRPGVAVSGRQPILIGTEPW